MPRPIASLGLLLALSLAVSGCLGVGTSPSDVRAEVLKEGLAKQATCRTAGNDADGNGVWRCKLTLTGDPAAPQRAGKQVVECFSKIKQLEIMSLIHVPCDRVSPQNAGSPAS